MFEIGRRHGDSKEERAMQYVHGWEKKKELERKHRIIQWSESERGKSQRKMQALSLK